MTNQIGSLHFKGAFSQRCFHSISIVRLPLLLHLILHLQLHPFSFSYDAPVSGIEIVSEVTISIQFSWSRTDLHLISYPTSPLLGSPFSDLSMSRIR